MQDPDSTTYTEVYLTNYRLIVARPIPKSIPYGFIQSVHIDDRLVKLKLKTGVVVDLNTDYNTEIEGYIKQGMGSLPFCFHILREP